MDDELVGDLLSGPALTPHSHANSISSTHQNPARRSRSSARPRATRSTHALLMGPAKHPTLAVADDASWSQIVCNNTLQLQVEYHITTCSTVPVDGFGWRKFGEKRQGDLLRSYYKCSHGQCRARKWVQPLQHHAGVLRVMYYGDAHSHVAPQGLATPQSRKRNRTARAKAEPSLSSGSSPRESHDTSFGTCIYMSHQSSIVNATHAAAMPGCCQWLDANGMPAIPSKGCWWPMLQAPPPPPLSSPSTDAPPPTNSPWGSNEHASGWRHANPQADPLWSPLLGAAREAASMDGSARASTGTSIPPPTSGAHTPFFTPPLLRHPSVLLDTPLGSSEELGQLFACEDGQDGMLVPWEVAWGDLEEGSKDAVLGKSDAGCDDTLGGANPT